jgi:hypothetical protein
VLFGRIASRVYDFEHVSFWPPLLISVPYRDHTPSQSAGHICNGRFNFSIDDQLAFFAASILEYQAASHVAWDDMFVPEGAGSIAAIDAFTWVWILVSRPKDGRHGNRLLKAIERKILRNVSKLRYALKTPTRAASRMIIAAPEQVALRASSSSNGCLNCPVGPLDVYQNVYQKPA